MIDAADIDKLEAVIVAAARAATAPLHQRIDALETRLLQQENRPELRYLGVWEAGRQYGAGAAVTHGGSVWIASSPTSAKPGEGATPWVLAVKRGRDAPRGREEAV